MTCKLIVLPKSCLQDDKMTVRISGLSPNSQYTISSLLQDIRKNKFFAYAHYIADCNGIIDTSQHESFGGHFKGVFQMGLIAALQPEPNEYKYLRLFKRDIETPNKIEIRLYNNFQTPEEVCSSSDSFIVNSFHYRHFMGPGVKRYTIREGRVRGTLFVPLGEGPFPGVVDMFGTAGGLLEYRSAQLASRGIVALALAFFDYEDLPKFAREYDISYFREAVQVLLNHDKVIKPHVGVIGVSKGADLALSMGAFIPEVGATVSISGCCSNLVFPLRVREGYVLPILSAELSRGKFLSDMNIFINRDTYDDPEDYPETIIPIHKTDGKFLFIVGENDLNLNTMRYASIAAKNMRNENKENNIKICSYKGAGHLIEPPYSPVCSLSYHNTFGMVFMWGGELEGHTQAQEKSWLEIIRFIKTNLKIESSKL